MNALILAAGVGSRLKPYTNNWPKALMPINGTPLLEIWIEKLFDAEINKILINTHHFSSEVEDFINRDLFKKYKDRIYLTHEKKLLGTAGTIKKNIEFADNKDLLVLHADNFSDLNICSFIDAFQSRPKTCNIGMVTFETSSPSLCGIVKVDEDSIVRSFHEKPKTNLGKLANGAIYVFDPSAIDFINKSEFINDISLDVIPKFVNKIFAWNHNGIFIDIGNEKNLLLAQKLYCSDKFLDHWYKNFIKNDIHDLIESKINTGK